MFWSLIIAIVFIITGTVTFHLVQNNRPIQIAAPLTQNVVQIQKEVEETLLFVPKTPTLEQIFANDHSWTSTISAQRKRVMLATGDVIPARVVNIQTTKYKNFKWPYEKVADILRNADVTFINLETPLIKDCPLVNDGFKFCGSDKNVEGLIFAGVDVASLANNHAGNYGMGAIHYTNNLLNSNNILVTGQNGSIYKNVRGLTFAFLGYNDIGYKQEGIAWADEIKISSEIAEASEKADIVVVTFHWGIEYQSQPNNRQRFLGHLAIDSGADLVIGNHPHWIQPIEIYEGKLITYAYGNFVFDQEWSLKTKQGLVGKYTFYDNRLVDVEFLPVQIQNYGQPYFIDNLIEEQKIITEMLEESNKLSVETKSYSKMNKRKLLQWLRVSMKLG